MSAPSALADGAVARLLVRAVAEIARMAVRDDAELARDRKRRVVAAVVDQQHAVDDIVRNRRVALRERLLRAVRGHDDGDPVSVQHAIGGV